MYTMLLANFSPSSTEEDRKIWQNIMLSLPKEIFKKVFSSKLRPKVVWQQYRRKKKKREKCTGLCSFHKIDRKFEYLSFIKYPIVLIVYKTADNFSLYNNLILSQQLSNFSGTARQFCTHYIPKYLPQWQAL